MSEWKLGDRAYLPVTVSEISEIGIYYVPIGGWSPVQGSSLVPITPAPVDVSQIKVGDEVTVRGVVVNIDSTSMPYHVETSHGELVWLSGDEIASHTPSRPPSTLAEFKAMTDEQQERWFNEMVKGKVTT